MFFIKILEKYINACVADAVTGAAPAAYGVFAVRGALMDDGTKEKEPKAREKYEERTDALKMKKTGDRADARPFPRSVSLSIESESPNPMSCRAA